MRDLEKELCERDQRIDELLESVRRQTEENQRLNARVAELMALATVVSMDETGWNVSATLKAIAAAISNLSPEARAKLSTMLSDREGDGTK